MAACIPQLTLLTHSCPLALPPPAGFFLMLGSVGFRASLGFVRHIYKVGGWVGRWVGGWARWACLPVCCCGTLHAPLTPCLPGCCCIGCSALAGWVAAWQHRLAHQRPALPMPSRLQAIKCE